MKSTDSICLILIFAVTSWCYATQGGTPFLLWLPYCLFLSGGIFFLLEIARLTLPNHRRGSVLGVALFVLAPHFAGWACVPDSGIPAFLMAAAALFFSLKLYFRDGPKLSSLFLLAAALGSGLAVSPASLMILPAALVPAISAGRNGAAKLRVMMWLLLFGAIFLGSTRWIFPLPEWPTASVFRFSSLELLHGSYAGWIFLGLLLGRQENYWRCGRIPAGVAGLVILSAIAWMALGQHLPFRAPRFEDWSLILPGLTPLSVVGAANGSDWLRRQRWCGNAVAEHTVLWGLVYLLIVNTLCLWFNGSA